MGQPQMKTIPLSPEEETREKIEAAVARAGKVLAQAAEKGELEGIGQIVFTAAASSPGYASWHGKAKFKPPKSVESESQSFASSLFPDQSGGE